MKYYAYCQGPSGFRKLESINTSIYSILDNTALDKDWYQSVYLYDDEHLEEYKTKKTLAGITGVVTNRLVFDFDSKANIEHAKNDAIEAYTRLVMHGIPEKCILICFSGMKGFSIEFKVDKLLTVEESRSIAEALMKGIKTFDPVIYDAQRIFRVPLSKHNKSGLYKIPLMRDQLESLTIEEILEEAKTTDGIEPDSLVLDTCPLPSGIYEMRNKEVTKKSTVVDPVSDLKEAVKRIDFSMKPKYLNKIKYVAQEGYFEEGDRSNLLMALGATYKAQGFNKAMVYRMLKGVAQNQSDVMGAERFEDEKVWNTIIKPLFEGDKWNGGTYGMDHPAIKKYAEKIGMEVDTTENKPLTIFEASDDFELYIENLEANTIKIGIPDLDEAAPLTTGTNVMILGGPGCHAKGTEILMYDGTVKKVEEVVVGDLLMGPDSQSRKVLQLHSGTDTMVKIKPYRSEEFVVNLHHVLHLVPSKKKTRGLQCPVNIKVKDFLEKSTKIWQKNYKLKRQNVEWGEAQLPIDPYILGSWLGDGSSNLLAITTMDDEISDYWKEYFERNGYYERVQFQKSNKSQIFNYSVGRNESNKFLDVLKALKLRGNKHVPQIYKNSSRAQRLEILAGLLDTDGHLHHKASCYDYISVSETLANDVVFLARSLGFHASINESRKYCTYQGKRREGVYHRVYISGTVYEIPCKLKRKQSLIWKMQTEPQKMGFDYEVLGEGVYYGFTLDKDHLYLTSDFFIHHNSGKTSMALEILENTSKQGITSVVASLDMHRNRLLEKLYLRISGLARKELHDVFKNPERQAQKEKLRMLLKENYANVYFYDRSSPTVQDVREYIEQIKDKDAKQVKLVLVDYFERISCDLSDDTASSKRVASQLQDLCNDLNVCLITLVQPNKMSGDASEPIYSYTNIKGSSYLGQSARIIFSIWRPFFSAKHSEHDKFISIALLKNDLGELSQFDYRWHGRTGKISPLTDEQRGELSRLLDAMEASEENDKSEKARW